MSNVSNAAVQMPGANDKSTTAPQTVPTAPAKEAAPAKDAPDEKPTK